MCSNTSGRGDSFRMPASGDSLTHAGLPAATMRDGADIGGGQTDDPPAGGQVSEGDAGGESAILDQLCEVNGWRRDHARKAAGGRCPPPLERRGTATGYSPEVVVEALRICWAVLDGPTGKRLAPALPMLVASLRRHGELTLDDATAGLLSGMSAATIDRRLAGDRAQLQTGRVGRGPSPGRCTAREIRLLNQLAAGIGTHSPCTR